MGFFVGSLVNLLGLTMTTTIAYELCARWGHRAFQRFIGGDVKESSLRLLNHYGPMAIVLTRPLPMMTELFSAMAGLSCMDRRRFHWACLGGNLPLALLYAWAGARGETLMPWLTLMLALILPALMVGWLSRRVT